MGDPIGVVSSLQFVTLGVENREQGPRHEEVGNELRLAEPAEPLRGELQVNAFLIDLQCNELSHEERSKACHNVADLERASKQHHLSGSKSYHTWHKGVHHLILYAFKFLFSNRSLVSRRGHAVMNSSVKSNVKS